MRHTAQHTIDEKQLSAAVRRRVEENMRKAREALETLAEMGVSVRLTAGGESANNGADKPGRIEAETWPDAVDRVLAEHPHGLTVVQIAKRLQAEGRVFPTKGRPEAPVANSMQRQAEKRGWTSKGRPAIWRKTKGGESQ